MGGGAMRAAAKMAGFTAASGGILSITAEHYSATRKAASAHPVTAALEEMKLVTNNSEATLQRPCLELEEWVFPDAEEAAGERMPRVVFGGVPTLQEAKEATSELSAALEKTYLSAPNSVENDDSETKACITTQLAVSPSVPAPAITAFKFLNESSMAKNVVASIACDQNVWNAVLQNEDLQQFLQSHTPRDPHRDWTEPVADYDGADQNSSMGSDADYDPKSPTGSSKHSEYEFVGGFVDIIQKMKSSVADMVSNLSGYMQNLFGAKGGSVNSDRTARVTADAVMQASFMGLAVMAILVILLKRTSLQSPA
ncbi:uncharacterized protein LOC131007818 [Salvia miltiorrhiza]|uniref:uncharacterized protein LOC131007818 n=1 Tax=Salvia miltiorrhiza TaxID=226208 RepID=UPI0025AD2416|nr:uncharacterized protein LOC131007818 [Salvia miltiorrhiza]